jgi:hypothetical protein
VKSDDVSTMPKPLAPFLAGLAILAVAAPGIYQWAASRSDRATPAASAVETTAASAPAGFMGRPWGSPPTADLQPLGRFTIAGLSTYVTKGPPPAFGGIPVSRMDLKYDRGRLYGAELYFKGLAARQDVKMAAMLAFGKPSSDSNALQLINWDWPDEDVRAKLYYMHRVQETTVSVFRVE